MIILLHLIKRPNVVLIELEDGDFTNFSNVNKDRMKLSRVSVFPLSFLFVVSVYLLFR